ncbi:MAG: hypothetical protein AAF909_04930 [Pseudomonadota bacterium]
MPAAELHETLTSALQDWRAGWSVGSFGAIAEFHQDEGEALQVDAPAALTRATARGAIRIDRLEGARPVAYETLSPRAHRWSHGVALCLPTAEAARPERRKHLTELDLDRDAIRAEDRDGLLFDMGLDQPQIDFCIRTQDPALIETLRGCVGRSLFEADNPAMGAILAAHPHRVAISNVGRAEVFQPIGGPATGGVSPEGPHTHVLPKLLRAGRTHSANTPIPEGWTPCAMLHPANPVIGPLGEDTPFDGRAFDAFQRLLELWAAPSHVETKRDVLARLSAGDGPEEFDEPAGRLERAALRLALRQQARLAEAEGDAARETVIAAWRRAFDAKAVADDGDPHV